ncbi:MAG: LptF/LptG family permease [Chitinispirillaceae bacterium]|jgi:lipopolysaccharide export system permease protein|nr:LptF/LptG family permease [Chitinispirillaceae bacterium]
MILYRYIIKETVFPFAASLSIIVFYFIMQQAVNLLGKIVEKGLDPLVVLEVFVVQLGWIIALAIPMSILTASLWTFGRMSGDNEITSIKASGQSLITLLLPMFAAAAVCTVLLVYFNDLILPDANHRTANLLSDISRKRPAAFIEPRVLIRDFAGYTLYADEVNPRIGAVKKVQIFSDQPGSDPSSTIAARGVIKMTPDQKFLELTLYNGETHSISRQNGREYFVARFGRQVVYIRNVDSRLERTSSSYRSDREMSSQAMLTEVSRIKADNTVVMREYRMLMDSLARTLRSLDSLPAAPAAPAAPADFTAWARGFSPEVATVKVRELSGSAARAARQVRSNNLQISQFMVEVHKKYAIPFACIMFMLIGAPLGIMARRGGLTVGATYSIFFFIAYWAFLIGGESLGDKLIVSPGVAMWTGNIIIGICGIILMILMLRETTIRFDFILSIGKKIAGGNSSFFRVLSGSFPVRAFALFIRGPKWILRRIVGTLPLYLISMFTGYVTGLFFAFIVIFVVIDYVSNLRSFENAYKSEIVLYYWYYLPFIVQVTFPIVLLLAAMFAMGRLAKHSEIIAMKAAGIGIRRLTLPLLALGIVFAIGTFYAGEMTLPVSNIARKNIADTFRSPHAKAPSAQYTRQKEDLSREFKRNFYFYADKCNLYRFGEFGTRPFVARTVSRQTFDSARIVERVEAQSMACDSAGWRFVKGTVRTFTDGGSTLIQFDTLLDTVLAVSPAAMVVRIKSIEEMSYWELESRIDAARRRGEKVRRYEGELEFKKALPVINFIVILLGIAITARAGRKGSAMLFGVGLALSFSYWLLSRFAIVFAQNGHLPTLVGAWVCNVLFLLLGIVLYRKASQ